MNSSPNAINQQKPPHSLVAFRKFPMRFIFLTSTRGYFSAYYIII